MSQNTIHPMAIVEPGAKLGENVTVEAFAVVKSTVTLHDNVTIKSHAYIDGNTTIGAGTTIYPMASIGTKTQDLKYQGEETYVKIGKNCEIREFVTINASSGEGTSVEVGDECLIMAYCHIAHNCIVGNRVLMSNNATLAGHVTIEDHAIIGGLTPIHQFVRIGCYAMIGGGSQITHDIPPYTIGAGDRFKFKFGGLNLIGLKRHGFPFEVRKELSKAFKITFRSQTHLNEALKQIEDEVQPLSEVKHWVDFCRKTKRGLMRHEGDLSGTETEFPYIEEEEEIGV